MKFSATLCCAMTCYFQGSIGCTRFTFFLFSLSFSIFSFLSFSYFLCFFFKSIHLSLCLCPLNSGSHYSLFRLFYHSPALSPSIHPPYCLTGRVCCFYPTDIGSLPRARPGTGEFSLMAPLGPAPSWASMFPCEITTYPAYAQAFVGIYTHS